MLGRCIFARKRRPVGEMAKCHVSRFACGNVFATASLAVRDFGKCAGATSRKRNRTLGLSCTDPSAGGWGGGLLFLYAFKLCYPSVGAKPVSGKTDPVYGINITNEMKNVGPDTI